MYKIFIIFVFYFANLYSDEQFIISYRGVVKENKLYSEQFNLSKAMKLKDSRNSQFITTLDYEENEDLILLLKKNQDLLTQELFKQGVMINDNSNNTLYSMHTKTVLILPPTYITVSINEDFVNIRVIK